jgi:adenylosuccinate lyase
MMALSKKGADRQETHELLRAHAMTAWQSVKKGEKNPLTGLLLQDAVIAKWLQPAEIEELTDVSLYTGISSIASVHLADIIQKSIQ